MNKFEELFFKRYLPEWVEVKWVIHLHIFVILWDIIINYFFWVLVPSFLYYNSHLINSNIPFFILEILIFFMFFRIMYKIFNWYNDAWILTKDWVVHIEWQLFELSSTSVNYDNIEWIELIQSWIIDTIFGKWDLSIQKIWWDNFLLNNASRVWEAINELDKLSKEWRNSRQKKLKEEKEELEKLKSLEQEKEKFKNKNFETLFNALSEVVEDYLWKSWYEKSMTKEADKESYIKEIKKTSWTIDIR